MVCTEGEKREAGLGGIYEEIEGGSGAGDAMQRKEEGRGTGPGGVWSRQGHAAGGGGLRSGVCRMRRGAGRCAWAGRAKEEAGPGPREQCDFNLKQISKLNTI
jgi:hypothetical protein